MKRQTHQSGVFRCLAVPVAAVSILTTPLHAQITAVDDGAPGSPFQTTDEDTALAPGNSLTANDTGSIVVTSLSVVSDDGVPVTIAPTGEFTYDPAQNGDAQVMTAGGSLEDQFSYTITELPTPSVTADEELNIVTGTNTAGWGNLPAVQAATGANLPPVISSAYTFGGRATRATYNGNGDTADFSLEFWVKANALDDQVLWETGGATIGSSVLLNSDGTISHFHTITNPESNQVRSDFNIATYVPGTWHHIVVTGDLNEGGGTADRIKIYLDGVVVADDATFTGLTDWSGSDTAGLGGGNGGDIGGDVSGTGPLQTNYSNFAGQIAVMKFYRNTVLSDAEVLADYNAWTSPASDSATVTLAVTGANDAPDATDDVFTTGPTEDDASFSGTRDLTANDGIFANQTNDVSAPGSNLSRSGIPTITVSQSPTSANPPGGGVPTRGIDGDPSTFTHTETDISVDHNWTIDFGVDVSIESVDLANRSDCCGGRLQDITITIEDEAGAVLATSGVLNPDNTLGFAFAGGQPGLFFDFAAANGGSPVTGARRVVVTRTPSADTGLTDGDRSILSLGEVTVLGSSTVPGDLGDPLLVSHDARNTAGTGRWENRGTLGGSFGDWILGSGVTLNPSVTSARAQITAAYEWDGSTDATAVFANGTLEDLGGQNIDLGSVSIELWTKLDAADLSQISTLFETGGGTGTGIVIDNGELQFATGTLTGLLTYDLVTDPAGVMGGLAPTADFFQVTAILDQANDRGLLFVNGQLVASGSNGTTDWSGGDNAGLGHFQGDNHGGFQPDAAGTLYDTYFHGSIASFRLWGSALTGGAVRQNFEAVANGTDVDGDSLTVTGVVDATQTLVGLNTPATLASGAIVTITDATGSFTYEPNGAFDTLGYKENAVDTFTYEISDGNGGIGRATVHVPVSGLTDANDDTIAATELITTIFAANALIGNDERLGGTTGAYFRIDPADETGGVIPNTGSGGSAFDLALTGGTVITPPALATNFGGIAAALQNGAGTFTSLNTISEADTTFEMWFQPALFTTGQQILLDSGGAVNGLSIIYDADLGTIVFTVDSGDDVADLIQATAGGVVPGEFNQLVAIYDKDNPTVEDSLAVYLNGDPTSFDGTVKGSGINTGGTANDWAGTDASGIGDYTGAAALGQDPSPFLGQIGITRIYPTKLSLAEIEANFNAVVQPVTSLVGGSPVTTALGATVTLNADGSISYDASSLNSDIPEGNVVQDSFQYTIDDGTGTPSTATVTVDVNGVGTFLAVDDNFSVGEDDGATTFDVRANDFDATAATVLFQTPEASYLDDLQGGAVVGDDADFRDIDGYGWQLLWNAPDDWDLAFSPDASIDGTGGALGTSANYVPLKWSGTRWTPDGDDDTDTNQPASFARISTDGTGHPGLGSGTDGGIGNAEDRAVIAAYTVPATGYYGIANSTVTSTGGGAIAVVLYVEDTLQGSVSVPGGGTGTFNTALGLVNQGETIHVALSPDGSAGSDAFSWDFDLVTLPGPDAVPTTTFGTVSTDGTGIQYTPSSAFQSLRAGDSITETVSYTIDDGGTLSTATLTVTVDGANDAPVGTPDDDGITNENWVLSGAGLLANDTDIDQGETISLLVGAVQGAAANVGVPTTTDLGASVTVNADGSFIYDPTGAFEAHTLDDPDLQDSFSYAPQDVNGADGDPVTVSITVVGLESNQQPLGNGLTATIGYGISDPSVAIGPGPSVSDPNGASPVTSRFFSAFSTTTSVTQNTLPDPGDQAAHELGMSVALVFTPAAGDVAPGGRVCVYNNGGTSNGNGIYLLDGIPHFMCAMNSSQANAPATRNDTDFSDNGKICLPLAVDALPAGVPTEIGIFFQLDRIAYTVNGAAPVVVELTRPSNRWNWSGDDSITFGDLDSVGSRAALSDELGDFDLTTYTAPAGTFQYGEIWYSGLADETGLTPESLTATLIVNPAEGALTAPDGASYDSGTGVWTATGSQDRINGLIATTEFIPNGTAPVDVAVSIADGGEGGTVPVTGTLTFVIYSPIEKWRSDNFGDPADTGDGGNLANPDGDQSVNILEFGFGTDPNLSDDGPLLYDAGGMTVTSRGTPVVVNDAGTFKVRFLRRADQGASGSASYAVEFASDLTDWETSASSPTVLAADGDYEVVELAFPATLLNGKQPFFARVSVTELP